MRYALKAIGLGKTNGKQAFDLLDLPQKERIRLCKEIRSFLRQKVLVEKASEQETDIEPKGSRRTIRNCEKVAEHSLARIDSRHIWNRPV